MTFHKYKKIYRLGHEENKDIFLNPDSEIVISEKVDGANVRIGIIDGKLIFGSRTQELDPDTDQPNFKRVFQYVAKQLEGKDLSFLNNKILYGEGMFKHTLNYDWDRCPAFVGFDVLDLESGKFLHYLEAKAVFESLDLSFVPIISVVRAGDIVEINDSTVPISKFGNIQAEGIVLKNHSDQIYAKYVRDAFKEANSEAFGGSPKYNKVDDTNNAEFVYKYCTNARIDKVIYSLIAEGNALDMKLMGELIKRTYMDIIEEEWKEILTSNWKLAFKDIRKLIAKRCVSVLNQFLVNNSLT